MTSKDENRQETNAEEPKELPIIPVPDDLVIFPYMPPVPPFSAASRRVIGGEHYSGRR